MSIHITARKSAILMSMNAKRSPMRLLKRSPILRSSIDEVDRTWTNRSWNDEFK